ncbi:hypothetical protein CR513_57329, partial [Mucuna pruriens]
MEEARGKKEEPHDIDTKVSSELDEEVVHLTQVSGITVRVQEGEAGKRVFPEGGNDLVAGLRVQNVNVDIFIGGDTRHHHPPVLLSTNVVRWRLWREKREFRGHCSRHIAHLITSIQHEPKRGWCVVFTWDDGKALEFQVASDEAEGGK